MSMFKCLTMLLSVGAMAGIPSREYLLDEDIRRFLYNECRVGRKGIPCYHDGSTNLTLEGDYFEAFRQNCKIGGCDVEELKLHYCCLGPHCPMECDPINSWPGHLNLFRNYETHVPIVMRMAAPLFDSSVQFLKDWPETMVSPATEHLFKEYRRQLMLFHDTILRLIRESAPDYN